ncbi:hypothetical protein RBE51_21345 [Pseudomonas taiwanensis]|uniref:hypothetical protein n=1 Tax=Pseudomonas taiwanensis TaxID=470150 RepID=UPI0028DF983D|nr:hypothetical protein [Pseudomonas taiwanensis]MDT8925344.1 hypothetical protein [Pseudomonas taiwanensis]
MKSAYTTQDLQNAILGIMECYGSGDPATLHTGFDHYSRLAQSMLAEGLGHIVFQEAISLVTVTDVITRQLGKHGASEPSSLIEVILQRAPITTGLAKVVLQHYPALTQQVGDALLSAPYELASQLASKRRDAVFDVIRDLAKQPQGQAGRVLTQAVIEIGQGWNDGGFAYDLLYCVGRLPREEISTELQQALCAREDDLRQGVVELSRVNRFYATPPLMLGAYRTGSERLKDELFTAECFTDIELYEMESMIREPLKIDEDLAASYLRCPGETHTFMLTLFAGNPSLDPTVATSLYRRAWVGQGPNGKDSEANDPKASFAQLVRAYKMLIRFDLLDEDRMAAMLNDLFDGLPAQVLSEDGDYLHKLLTTNIQSNVLLKTRYGRAHADSVLEIDLGL